MAQKDGKLGAFYIRCYKNLPYTPADLKKALRIAKSGKMTFVNAAKAHNMSEMTLRRYGKKVEARKNKMLQENNGSESQKAQKLKLSVKNRSRKASILDQKPRKFYSHFGDMKAAVQAVQKKKLTVTDACKKYRVSGSTLRRRMSSLNGSPASKHSPQRVKPKESHNDSSQGTPSTASPVNDTMAKQKTTTQLAHLKATIQPGHCAFCQKSDNDEDKLGKKYTNNNLTVHYFCMLFASGLCQNGNSESEGIMGFMSTDILKEVRRSLRLRCVFCRRSGATIGCVVSRCRAVFHLPCGLDNGVLTQFTGQFSSFCEEHRPRQTIPSSSDRLAFHGTAKSTCAICMCSVDMRSSNNTIRSPCCKNSWFHRACLQMHAKSSGLHFFKCPLCNNKEMFQEEMLIYGIYIPDQDAAWEREPNAFQELLIRHNRCDDPSCKCPHGSNYSKENTKWEIMLCDMCGSAGTHLSCAGLKTPMDDWECLDCSKTCSGLAQPKTKEKPQATAQNRKLSVEGDKMSNKISPAPTGRGRKRKLSDHSGRDTDGQSKKARRLNAATSTSTLSHPRPDVGPSHTQLPNADTVPVNTVIGSAIRNWTPEETELGRQLQIRVVNLTTSMIHSAKSKLTRRSRLKLHKKKRVKKTHRSPQEQTKQTTILQAFNSQMKKKSSTTINGDSGVNKTSQVEPENKSAAMDKTTKVKKLINESPAKPKKSSQKSRLSNEKSPEKKLQENLSQNTKLAYTDFVNKYFNKGLTRFTSYAVRIMKFQDYLLDGKLPDSSSTNTNHFRDHETFIETCGPKPIIPLTSCLTVNTSWGEDSCDLLDIADGNISVDKNMNIDCGQKDHDIKVQEQMECTDPTPGMLESSDTESVMALGDIEELNMQEVISQQSSQADTAYGSIDEVISCSSMHKESSDSTPRSTNLQISPMSNSNCSSNRLPLSPMSNSNCSSNRLPLSPMSNSTSSLNRLPLSPMSNSTSSSNRLPLSPMSNSTSSSNRLPLSPMPISSHHSSNLSPPSSKSNITNQKSVQEVQSQENAQKSPHDDDLRSSTDHELVSISDLNDEAEASCVWSCEVVSQSDSSESVVEKSCPQSASESESVLVMDDLESDVNTVHEQSSDDDLVLLDAHVVPPKCICGIVKNKNSPRECPPTSSLHTQSNQPDEDIITIVSDPEDDEDGDFIKLPGVVSPTSIGEGACVANMYRSPPTLKRASPVIAMNQERGGPIPLMNLKISPPLLHKMPSLQRGPTPSSIKPPRFYANSSPRGQSIIPFNRAATQPLQTIPGNVQYSPANISQTYPHNGAMNYTYHLMTGGQTGFPQQPNFYRY